MHVFLFRKNKTVQSRPFTKFYHRLFENKEKKTKLSISKKKFCVSMSFTAYVMIMLFSDNR